MVAIIFVALAASIWANNQSGKARSAFNDAMDVYDAPIQQPGQAAVPNAKTYATAAARAADANPLFENVASKYGFFKAGQNARYFAGLTANDMGNAAAAEADLKKASTSRDAALASLGKMALASFYVNHGRTDQGVAVYHDVIDHPTLAVSANAARLALAATEESTNPQDARQLYAKVKDSDKTTAAGQIATQKLSGK
ncbi:coatomer subunit epsilon [Acidipila sp. EB88]|nr:coatomer subunit epsilon [Acidipila sp. EB88]